MPDGIIHVFSRAQLAITIIDRQRRNHERANSARADGDGERPEGNVGRNHDTQYPGNTIGPALHGPNENKMSDGWRESASLGVEGRISWKVRSESCQPFAPSHG